MSSDNSDSEEEGPELLLDPRFAGRVPLNDPSYDDPNGPDKFAFKSFKGALGIGPNSSASAPLLSDCRATFTATSVQESGDDEAGALGVSSGETYWLGATEAPRCGLEKLAREIFDFHAKRLGFEAGRDFNPDCSGAEWWTQCIEGDAEIGFHFDKDYSLEENSGLDLFPHLGTITYLTGASERQAPTLIVEHAPTRQKQGESDDDGEGESPYSTCASGVRKAWLSSACPGKHTCFNGRHLHGAAEPLAKVFAQKPVEAEAEPKSKKQRVSKTQKKEQEVEEKNGLRVTFLVNLWFNWKPLGSDPLPDAVASEMSLKGDGPLSFGVPGADESLSLTWSCHGEASAAEPAYLRRRFEQRGKTHILEVPLPGGMKHDDDGDEASDSEDEVPEEEGEELPSLPYGSSAVITWPEPGPPLRVFPDPNDEDIFGDSDESESDDEDRGPPSSKDEKKFALISALIDLSQMVAAAEESGGNVSREHNEAMAQATAAIKAFSAELDEESNKECQAVARAALLDQDGGSDSGDDEENGGSNPSNDEDSGEGEAEEGAGDDFEIVD